MDVLPVKCPLCGGKSENIIFDGTEKTDSPKRMIQKCFCKECLKFFQYERPYIESVDNYEHWIRSDPAFYF